MPDARLGTMLTFISGPLVALAEPGKVIARGAKEPPLVCVVGSDELKPARLTGRPLWGADDAFVGEDPAVVDGPMWRVDDDVLEEASEEGRIVPGPGMLEVDLMDGI